MLHSLCSVGVYQYQHGALITRANCRTICDFDAIGTATSAALYRPESRVLQSPASGDVAQTKGQTSTVIFFILRFDKLAAGSW